jgi:hypothetical protein
VHRPVTPWHRDDRLGARQSGRRLVTVNQASSPRSSDARPHASTPSAPRRPEQPLAIPRRPDFLRGRRVRSRTGGETPTPPHRSCN